MDPREDPEFLAKLAVAGVRPSMDLTPADPALQQLLDYWTSKLNGRAMPSRADIDPTEIPHLLPDLLLAEVHYEPRRYRWRLIGTAVTGILGRDSTNKWFDELYEGKILEAFEAVMDMTLAVHGPVRFEGTGRFANKDYLAYESLHLPLSKDGTTIDMILLSVRYRRPAKT
jgi:hypothetical protein